jgi:hypothetical protein
VILNQPAVRDGWLIYQLKPVQSAYGSNVVAFKLNGRNTREQERVTIEKYVKIIISKKKLKDE